MMICDVNFPQGVFDEYVFLDGYAKGKVYVYMFRVHALTIRARRRRPSLMRN